MKKYRPQDLYFAIESLIPDQFVAFLTPKEIWDEHGEPELVLASSFEDNYFPDFLNSDMMMQSTFEPLDEDLSSDDLREKMEDAGFEYSLELQTFLSDMSEEEDDQDEDEEETEEENDGFWDILDPKTTLN